jgi:hypothetical protein
VHHSRRFPNGFNVSTPERCEEDSSRSFAHRAARAPLHLCGRRDTFTQQEGRVNTNHEIGFASNVVGFTSDVNGFASNEVGFTSSVVGLTTNLVERTCCVVGCTLNVVGFTSKVVGFTTEGNGVRAYASTGNPAPR